MWAGSERYGISVCWCVISPFPSSSFSSHRHLSIPISIQLPSTIHSQPFFLGFLGMCAADEQMVMRSVCFGI